MSDTLSRQRKKELALYSDTHQVSYRTELDEYLDRDDILRLNTYQAFVANLFSPNTDLDKILLIHGTGTGKTLSSLAVAKKYIEFAKESPDDVHSVIIVGFTHGSFKRELISHPVFGFLSQDELNDLKDMSGEAVSNPEIQKKLDDTKRAYMRRLKRKKSGGIFKFYGYKQLFNKIVNLNQISQLIAAGELESYYTSEDILRLIAKGRIDVNYSIIDEFRHSLIICDEIHNVYNGEEHNTWGTALELIIDRFNDPSLPNIYKSIRIMYLSATPMTSSPREVVSVINLLNNKENRVTDDMVFDKKVRSDKTEYTLTKKGEMLIRSKLVNKISYVMDNNIEQYPAAHFAGAEIKGIKYLKFVRSKMSPEQFIGYKNSILRIRDETNETSRHNFVYDMVMPSIDGTNTPAYDCDTYLDILNSTSSEAKKQAERLGISVAANGVPTGEFMRLDQLSNYSAKYGHMLSDLMKWKGLEDGKIFVYHPYVVSSGVYMIANILSRNGFLNQSEPPGQRSICMTCNDIYKDHVKSDHEFKPIRYSVVTGYMSKPDISNALYRFNRAENVNGEDVKILIGSRTMREGHTLKGVRRLLIMRCPNNISELIQIIGRGVRKHSHSLLSASSRTTEISIYTNSMPDGSLSKEETLYESRMLEYVKINHIESIMFDISLDYLINYRFNQQKSERLIGDRFTTDPSLHDQYVKDLKSISQLKEYSHNAYFIEDEIDYIKLIIKRIFLEYQRVLTYEELFELVLDPPFTIEMNTSLLSKGSFAIALNDILYTQDDYYQINTIARRVGAYYNGVMSRNKVFMDAKRNKYCIVENDGLYVMQPLQRLEIDKRGVMINNATQSNIGNQSYYELMGDAVTGRWESDAVNLHTALHSVATIVDPLDQLEAIAKSKKPNSSNRTVKTMSIEQHKKMVQYLLELIYSCVIEQRPHVDKDRVPVDIVLDLIQFYEFNMALITVSDTIDSTVASDYKSILGSSGVAWDVAFRNAFGGSKSKKQVNTMHMPIGHYVDINPCLYKQGKWVQYLSISKYKKYSHEYSFIAIESRSPTELNPTFKIKYLNQASKGIAISFLEKAAIIEMAREIGLDISDLKVKTQIVEAVITGIREIEKKYRLKKTEYKIYYMFYEYYQ